MAKFRRVADMAKGLMNLSGNVAKSGMGATKRVTKGTAGGVGGSVGNMAAKMGKAGHGFYAKKCRGN
jgi:hypothetical protein